jgi:hypothetical protein
MLRNNRLNGRVVRFMALIGEEVSAICLQPPYHGEGRGRYLPDVQV